MAQNTNKWTQEEKDRLTELYRQGKTDAQIAAVLGRTKKAVQLKRESLGLRWEIISTAEADLTENIEDLTEGQNAISIRVLNIEAYLARGFFYRLFHRYNAYKEG